MKKALSILLSICMLLSVTAGLSFSASALSSSGKCGDNVTYTFDSSTGKLIVSGTGAMYDYNQVTTSPYYRENNPFYRNSDIKKVEIGEGVTGIGDYSFMENFELESVNISNTVTRIGRNSFSNCTKLQTLNIPSSISYIEDYAFADCNLDTIVVDENNSVYDSRYNCNAIITKETNELIVGSNNSFIPHGVKSIGNNAFQGRTELSSIVLPEGITNIGWVAFGFCTNLTEIIIPSSVTTIGFGICNYDSKLSDVYYSGTQQQWNAISIDNWNDNLIQATRHYNYVYEKSSEYDYTVLSDDTIAISEYTGESLNVVIPDIIDGYPVTKIDNYAFNARSDIMSVTLPKYLKSIGEFAFGYCSGLKDINIPNGVSSIGARAFDNCSGLLSVTIPNSVSSFGEGTFADCSNLQTVSIPIGIEKIESALFAGCSSLTSITIPYGVTRIEYAAFHYCTNLASIIIPDSVVFIGTWAFQNCDNLQDVYYTSSEGNWNNVTIGQENSDLKSATMHYNYVCNIHTPKNNSGIITEPTCTEQGYTTYICSICGNSYNDDYTATINHTEVIDEAVAPTCTETGLTEGKHCSVCGEVLEAQETVSALGHSYNSVVTEPTCTERGYTTYTCNRCGESYISDYTNALGHTEVIDEAVAPTCTKTGLTEGSHCSVCGEILVAQQRINALGHSYEAIVTAPTCTEQGYTTYTCVRCNNSYVSNYTNPLGHTVVVDEAVSATCTTTGLTAGKHCSVCNEILVAQKTINALGHNYKAVVTAPTCTEQGYSVFTCTRCGDSYISDYTNALGHTEVIDEAVVPTCTETGLTEGKHCSVCGEVLVAQTIVPAIAHDYNAVVTSPTCTEQGYTTYTCTRCGDSYISDYTNALGHTEVIDEAVSATCTTTGLTEGKHCSVCNEILVAQGVVSALGHDFGEWIETSPEIAATCTEKGKTAIETRYCSRCDAYETRGGEETAIIAHTPGEAVYEVIFNPTCTNSGMYEKIVCCTVCNAELSRNQYSSPALGHNYELSVTAPSCTAQGYTTHTCTRCGDSYDDSYTDVLPHTPSEAVIENEVPATYEAEGSYDEVVYCSACNAELSRETKSIEKLHYHEYGYTTIGNVIQNTCTCDGSYDKEYHCGICDIVYETETVVVEKTGHVSMKRNEYKVAVSCTENGTYDVVTYCAVCNEEISRETKGIPATGHIYICQGKNEEGLLEYKCALCEEIHTESPKELFKNWSADLINNDVQSTKYDDSSLFDVVADGVINAKDYAYLLRNSR